MSECENLGSTSVNVSNVIPSASSGILLVGRCASSVKLDSHVCLVSNVSSKTDILQRLYNQKPRSTL